MRNRAVLPMIFALSLVGSTGCEAEHAPVPNAPGDHAPKMLVARPMTNVIEAPAIRSSRPITTLPTLHRATPRSFKETMLFVPAGRTPLDVALPSPPNEQPLAYFIPGATHDAPSTIDLRFPDSPIELTLSTATRELLFGDEGSIDVALTNDGAPIGDATIDATIEAMRLSPIDHVRTTLAARPIAAGRWSIDLSRAFSVDDASGVWSIEVRAKGGSFDRFGSIAVHYALPSARIATLGAPKVLDDGSIDVAASLDVATRDRLEIKAILTTTEGAPIAEANTTATFEAGRSETSLHFDPPVTSAPDAHGPFVLRRLRLFSFGSNTTLVSIERP